MSALEQLKRHRWHSLLLLAFLVAWGCLSTYAIVYSLAVSPEAARFGLSKYYFFLLIPILVLVSAFLLFTQNKWVLVSFAALPIAYVTTAIRLFPAQLNLSGRVIDLAYLLSFPPQFSFGALFFAFCLVYGAFLHKWGQLRWRDTAKDMDLSQIAELCRHLRAELVLKDLLDRVEAEGS